MKNLLFNHSGMHLIWSFLLRKPPIISNLKYIIWAHRPSIKGTKPQFLVIKAIFIICLPILWWWKRFLWSVEEKRFCWHNLSHSAWPWQWGANKLGKTELPSKVCMCGVSAQQWPSTWICLKGHVRAPDSTLWRHRLQEAIEFLYTKTPLLEGVEQPKQSPKTPGNVLSDAPLMFFLLSYITPILENRVARSLLSTLTTSLADPLLFIFARTDN